MLALVRVLCGRQSTRGNNVPMLVPSVANVPVQPPSPEQAISAQRESRAESTVGTDQSEQHGE